MVLHNENDGNALPVSDYWPVPKCLDQTIHLYRGCDTVSYAMDQVDHNSTIPWKCYL